MSGEKRFQKTFSRRKKASNDAEDQVQAVVEEVPNLEEEALVAPSSSAESQEEGGDGDREVSREPIANGGGCSGGVSKSATKKRKSDGGGGCGNVGRTHLPKQKRQKEEERWQRRKQKKQRKEELKMKPKQKQEEKKQIGKGGKEELKKGKKKEDKVEEEEAGAGCRFPVSRVDRIIRSEGSDYRITHEAVYLINKASDLRYSSLCLKMEKEKFLEIFCGYSYKCAAHDRKNYVRYNHLATVVSKEKRLDFLSDYVPEKVKAEKALAERKPVEK